MGGSIYHCYFLLMATDQAHVALAKYKKIPVDDMKCKQK